MVQLTMKIKFLKKYTDQLIGITLLTALYVGEAALRPFAGPHEYDFATQIAEKLPNFPQYEFMLRLPAAVLTLAGGALFYFLVKHLNFKRPGMAAVFYLLFPPVFYHGTEATLLPALSFGVLLTACGIQGFAMQKKFGSRAAALAAALAGAGITVIYLTSSFCKTAELWILMALLVIFVIVLLFDRKEKRDKERFLRLLNRFIVFFAVIGVLIAILIWIPVLLRHFKVDFPEGVALYGRHERIIRPVLMLIMTIVWLGLAKESQKAGKKLFLCSGALAFFLFFLPVTLPWQIQKDLYWHHTIVPLLKQINTDNCVCLCSKAEAPFFRRFFTKPLRFIGNGKNEIPVKKLQAEVEKAVKDSDVIIVCSTWDVEKQCPVLPGKYYSTGKFNFYYYYQTKGVDKK